MKIDKKLIKELVDYLNEFNLTELEYGQSNTKIKVSKKKSDILTTNEITQLTTEKKKTDLSLLVAERLSRKAMEKKITRVYFDRGGYKYHGRIKIFAEALRKGGLIF